METLIIPEIIILNAYKKALAYIRKDYKNNLSDLTKSYLGKLLGSTNAIQKYNLLEQSKAVFITDQNDPRHIDVNVFFNAKRATIPTIHIVSSGETPVHNALNISEGFQETDFNDTELTYRSVFNRRFKARYNIVTTSDNVNEVLLIYQVMRSMTISLIEHLTLKGLEDVKISGQDIQIKSDIVPLNVVFKGIGIEFEYDVPALKLSTADFSSAEEFIADGTSILE